MTDLPRVLQSIVGQAKACTYPRNSFISLSYGWDEAEDVATYLGRQDAEITRLQAEALQWKSDAAEAHLECVRLRGEVERLRGREKALKITDKVIMSGAAYDAMESSLASARKVVEGLVGASAPFELAAKHWDSLPDGNAQIDAYDVDDQLPEYEALELNDFRTAAQAHSQGVRWMEENRQGK